MSGHGCCCLEQGYDLTVALEKTEPEGQMRAGSSPRQGAELGVSCAFGDL